MSRLCVEHFFHLRKRLRTIGAVPGQVVGNLPGNQSRFRSWPEMAVNLQLITAPDEIVLQIADLRSDSPTLQDGKCDPDRGIVVPIGTIHTASYSRDGLFAGVLPAQITAK